MASFIQVAALICDTLIKLGMLFWLTYVINLEISERRENKTKKN